ncbi:hypothetical protein GCM10018773_10920 [Streptomyces candidus]|nr:hypothetical protein GCM10018773_10920 [Streptomyces candidus]
MAGGCGGDVERTRGTRPCGRRPGRLSAPGEGPGARQGREAGRCESEWVLRGGQPRSMPLPERACETVGPRTPCCRSYSQIAAGANYPSARDPESAVFRQVSRAPS